MMEEGKYVKNKEEGISVGKECQYRAKKIEELFVIYRMDDGKIIEKLPYEDVDCINEENAINRLYELNGLEKEVDKDTKDAMDMSG